ncbi:hypothetical protein KEM60_01177 [Austwickia sp. TVS 96-490-7B]|nr:hypothetical protein [Austwickia sp. TVS 96-490-7B]
MRSHRIPFRRAAPRSGTRHGSTNRRHVTTERWGHPHASGDDSPPRPTPTALRPGWVSCPQSGRQHAAPPGFAQRPQHAGQRAAAQPAAASQPLPGDGVARPHRWVSDLLRSSCGAHLGSETSRGGSAQLVQEGTVDPWTWIRGSLKSDTSDESTSRAVVPVLTCLDTTSIWTLTHQSVAAASVAEHCSTAQPHPQHIPAHVNRRGRRCTSTTILGCRQR